MGGWEPFEIKLSASETGELYVFCVIPYRPRYILNIWKYLID